MTNTSRTATEQLLISDAMDRTVSQVNFAALAGKRVFIDSAAVDGTTDSKYLLSLIRQHAFGSGCQLMEKREDAEVVMEVRVGTSGTDQNDTMVGINEMTIPSFPGFDGTAVPEFAIAKKTVQKAIVKIGIFAYDAETRRPLWQSGNLLAESRAKNRWILGMGPFQTGEIYDTATFDGTPVAFPLVDLNSEEEEKPVLVSDQVFYESGRVPSAPTAPLEVAEMEPAPKEGAGAEAADVDAKPTEVAKEGTKNPQSFATSSATDQEILAPPAHGSVLSPAPVE
ncbi:MAG: hypothetical protein Q4D38_09975 [Planctomycetia bacterium]|nr:hypothetical protein [Planctomycetia bacterium]